MEKIISVIPKPMEQSTHFGMMSIDFKNTTINSIKPMTNKATKAMSINNLLSKFFLD